MYESTFALLRISTLFLWHFPADRRPRPQTSSTHRETPSTSSPPASKICLWFVV